SVLPSLTSDTVSQAPWSLARSSLAGSAAAMRAPVVRVRIGLSSSTPPSLRSSRIDPDALFPNRWVLKHPAASLLNDNRFRGFGQNHESITVGRFFGSGRPPITVATNG